MGSTGGTLIFLSRCRWYVHNSRTGARFAAAFVANFCARGTSCDGLRRTSRLRCRSWPSNVSLVSVVSGGGTDSGSKEGSES